MTGVGTAKLRQAMEVQAAIASVLTGPQEVLDTTAREAQILVGATGAAVGLAEGDEMVSLAASGSVAHRLHRRRSLAGGLSGLCLRTGCAQRGLGAELEANPTPGQPGGQGSVALVPLVRSGATVGVLTVWSEATSRFDENDLTVLSMVAEVAAVAIDRERPWPESDYSAGRDALTNLPNRSGLFDHLSRTLGSLALRPGAVAVLVIDLDGFGALNRRFGHAAGDSVLEAIGARLIATVRRGDFVTRVGSDEFVIVSRLGAVAPVAGADGSSQGEKAGKARSRAVARLGARARRVFTEPVDVEGRLIRVAASMGAATSDDASESPATLVARAGAAMNRCHGLDTLTWDQAAASPR